MFFDKKELVFLTLFKSIEYSYFIKENINYNHFKDIKLDRKTIKQSIMTKVYNVTNYGIERQLESKMEKIEIDIEKE